MDEPYAYIQWKGVCADYHCACGFLGHRCHIDFAYYVKCNSCSKTYEVGDKVKLTEATPPNDSCVRPMQEAEEQDEPR